MDTYNLNFFLPRVDIDNIEDMKKYNGNKIPENINREENIKKYIKEYRKDPEKKELLKRISKKCYDKRKEDEEKYKIMLDKKKAYYQENKEKVLLRNKEKYNFVKELINQHKKENEKNEQSHQQNKITYSI